MKVAFLFRFLIDFQPYVVEKFFKMSPPWFVEVTSVKLTVKN